MNQTYSSIPEEAQVAALLESTAQGVQPAPVFQAALEVKLKAAFQARRPTMLPWKELGLAMGGAAALVVLALLLNWLIRSFIVLPEPAIGETPMPGVPSEQAPTPDGVTYDWHGAPLTLQTSLPDGPAQAFVYDYQLEQRATLESARALAAQFGLDGAIYQSPGETPNTTDFLIVDGNQRLRVRSDQYFQYYPDYPRYTASINGGTPPTDAEVVIDEFLKSHGFDFAYQLLPSEMYGGLLAAPLTPDGYPVCYEHFNCAELLFTLDKQGILSVDGALPKYTTLGQYEIISAEEAFQQILAPYDASNLEMATGMMEGLHSPMPPIQTWLRAQPLDQTFTLYGYLSSIPSAEGSAPLVSLDGYTVTGNTAAIPAALENTFVAATGQFHEQDGIHVFELETWQFYDGYEDGLSGVVSQQGDQVVLNTPEDEVLVLPDAPADLPLPLENAFVIGVRQGDTFEWKSIDLRNVMGGGGGGGDGSGFYQLNLTGTPIPFPTIEAGPEGSGGGAAVEAYLVQEGDTLGSIAAANGVTVEELMQLNDMADPSQLQVGQTLTVRAESMSLPQAVEGIRGMMSITIYKQKDGSQRVDYGFLNDATPFPYLLLAGENLEALQAYQNRPVDVWGTLEMHEGQPFLKVERYEIPFPDLGFQILRGRQESVTLEGQPATLFTTDEGATYVQFAPYGGVDGSTVGTPEDEVLLEALIIPGETIGGYPALRVFSGGLAFDPQTGQPLELQISSDQIYTVDLAVEGEFTPTTAAIERVELVYYMPDPRYKTNEFSPDEKYLQPAWLFSGHYNDGTEFFILVQALKRDFLLPETAPFTAPG